MVWIRVCLVVFARTTLCLIVGLVLCSLAPRLLGWQSDVVLTGSMEPLMHTGDVVAYQPFPASRVEPGQVMLVHDPAHPGHLLAHRFVRRDADGLMVTRGDANGHDDSTPVTDDAVIGVARLDIPRVGLPILWWSQGHRERTAVTVFALLALGAMGGIKIKKAGPTDATGSEQAERQAAIAVP